jgi:hypothetical protein
MLDIAKPDPDKAVDVWYKELAGCPPTWHISSVGFLENPSTAFIGWLLPDGRGIVVSSHSHLMVADYINKTEGELEAAGWVKLTIGPAIPGTGNFFLETYTIAYCINKPTRDQESFLNRARFFALDIDLNVRRFAHDPRETK